MNLSFLPYIYSNSSFCCCSYIAFTFKNIECLQKKKGRAGERKKEGIFFPSFPCTFPSDTVRMGKNSVTDGGIF